MKPEDSLGHSGFRVGLKSLVALSCRSKSINKPNASEQWKRSRTAEFCYWALIFQPSCVCTGFLL